MKHTAFTTFTKREESMTMANGCAKTFSVGDKVIRTMEVGNSKFISKGGVFTVKAVVYVTFEDMSQWIVLEGDVNEEYYKSEFFELFVETPQVDFKNMKFRVSSPEHSKEIQEALFEMGYKWFSGGEVVLHTEYNFLYTCDDGFITYRNVERNFKEKIENKEHSLVTTKSYKIIPKPETIEIDGKTYDKEAVLKRLAELEVVQG
jgi:hypothetical protein